MTKTGVLIIFIALLGCYPFLNRRRAKYFWVTKWDKYVPFWGIWAIAYVTYYFFWVIAIVLLWNKVFWQLFGSLITAEAAAVIFWYLVPNGVKKPKLENKNRWEKIMSYIYKIDGGTNGFPSGHVFMSLICGYYLTVTGYWWGAVVAVLISLSTVFVKQHYVIDILGGLIWAVGGIVAGRVMG